MSIYRNRRLFPVAPVVPVVLVAVAVCGCNRRPASDKQEYAAAATPGRQTLVGPPKDDTSEQIVSWVDGQVVTDWAAEISKRERAIEGYLDDTDRGLSAPIILHLYSAQEKPFFIHDSFYCTLRP